MRTVIGKNRMKGLEKETIEQIGIPAIVLMEQAAMGLAGEIKHLLPATSRILFYCGCGNNGADCLAAARILFLEDWDVEILLADPTAQGTDCYSTQKKACEGLQIPFRAWDAKLMQELSAKHFDAVVDGLFGIGLSRPVAGAYAETLKVLNEADCMHIAADIPSGLDADTGKALGTVFQADHTVTFGWGKIGMYLTAGAPYCGEISIVPLSIAPVRSFELQAEILEPEDIHKWLPARKTWSNKGTYGRLGIVAGSKGMAGAAFLCAKAALKCGCGMVKIYTPECNRTALQALLPEAMAFAYDPEGDVSEALKDLLSWSDVIIIGPGLGKADHAVRLLREILEKADCPTVLDGDALNILSDHPEFLPLLGHGKVLTPHMGEMSRLTGRAVSEIRNSMVESVQAFCLMTKAVVHCKDAVSVTADFLGNVVITNCGTNGMSTAGSGDVLAGIIGAFLAVMDEPFQAAALGAYVHGLSGCEAAAANGERFMTATDIIDGLKAVLKQ